MLLNKINKLINIINQNKVLNKNYFFILKTPESLFLLNLLQTENCINFFKIVKKEDKKIYIQVYLNIEAPFELFSLSSNFQQYFFKIKFLKKYLNSNIKFKLYLNTKNGIIRDIDALRLNVGGTLLFGIKYL